MMFQTQHLIEKVLDWENSHLYHKVTKQQCLIPDFMSHILETLLIIRLHVMGV